MLSPAPNPLDIFRSTKVTTVLGLIQPLGLSGNLTCLAALRFWAVALGPAIVRTRNKELSAMEALARRRRVHGEATRQPPAKPPLPLFNQEQKPKPKKNICVEDGRRKYPPGNPEVLVQTCRIRQISDRSPQGAACWSALTQVIRGPRRRTGRGCNCCALAYYQSRHSGIHNAAPKLCQNRIKYSSTGVGGLAAQRRLPTGAEFDHGTVAFQ